MDNGYSVYAFEPIPSFLGKEKKCASPNFNKMISTEKKYYNAFNLIPQIGPLRFKKLCSYFNSLEKAWQASMDEFRKAGLEEKVINVILEERNKINVEKEVEKLARENIEIVILSDENYPTLLKEIHQPPALLYVKGELKKDEFTIAIVGPRKVSSYGRQVAEQFSRELSQAGMTTVSGMALGVDNLVHRECLKLNNRTIAVLGSGIDQNSIYPSTNKKTAEAIIQRGAVISEYPFGTPPLKQHFPARNRIISGMSLATLVIEASEKSGALITANFSLEQNREVFAVPGSIYSLNSVGTNNLIKMGAKMATNAQEILDELNLSSAAKFSKAKEVIPDNEQEEVILKKLLEAEEPIHIDKLSKLTDISVTEISSVLTLMEMKGKVKNIGGMRYAVVR